MDVSLVASASASVNLLGMTCTLSVPNVALTTETSGRLTGQPVTGPLTDAQATVVGNTFPIPAIPVSARCPAAIAATLDEALHLPLPAGLGTFVAPVHFDFELNNPS
jgi:hypothetical protein